MKSSLSNASSTEKPSKAVGVTFSDQQGKDKKLEDEASKDVDNNDAKKRKVVPTSAPSAPEAHSTKPVRLHTPGFSKSKFQYLPGITLSENGLVSCLLNALLVFIIPCLYLFIKYFIKI